MKPTSVTLSPEALSKIDQVSQALGSSRSRALDMLLVRASVQEIMRIMFREYLEPPAAGTQPPPMPAPAPATDPKSRTNFLRDL